MKPNQHLKEIALLGSARKSIEPALLPAPIAEILEEKSFANSEDKVLEALSLQHYYNVAGTLPQKYSGAIDVKPIKETKPSIDMELESIFKQIIELETIGQERLMNNWLDVVIRKSQIISANQIVPILKFAKTSSKRTNTKIRAVIGEKGKWVMDQSDVYKIPKLDDSDELTEVSKIWTEGNAIARKTYFESLRESDQEAAIKLLQSTWNEEAIRDKVAFLKIIKSTYVASDVPFLNSLYKGEFKFNPKEKNLVRASRRIITDILLSIPTTELHISTIKQLANYIGNSKSKGLISKVFSKSKIPFILPKDSDDFWNENTMLEIYGYDETNPDIAKFKTDNLYWFSCLVQVIPFESWKKLFAADGKVTIDFFLNDTQFQNVINAKSESNLIASLIEQANNHKDQFLVLSLLKSIGRMDNVELLKLLAPENWEKYLIKNDLLYTSHALGSCNLKEGAEWSKSFTDTFVKRITKKLQEGKIVLDYQVGVTAANFFNVDSLPLLKRIHQSEANIMAQYNWWAKHFYSRIMETTSIRSQLKNYR